MAAALFTFAAPAAVAADTASVSGTVTVPAGVTIGPGEVAVTLYDYSTGDYVGMDEADATGAYSVTGVPAGSYRVSFAAYGKGLVQQYWKNAFLWRDATALKVAAGEAKTGINANLVKGATISGTVKLPAGTNAKYTDVWVSAESKSGTDSYGWGSIDSRGKYSITGLPAGSYKVRFGASYDKDLLEQWWKGKSTKAAANVVALTAGGTKAGIDATLVRGATISGKVSLPSGVKRAKDTYLGVSLYSGSKETYVSSVTVGSTGTYRLTKVPAGTYKLKFESWRINTLDQWYKGSSWKSAAKITVAKGQKKTGVSATLVKGSVISGKVTVPSGSSSKLGEVGIEVYQSSKRVYAGWTTVSSKGTYSVDRLPAGTYKVRAVPRDGTAAPQWSSGKSDWSSASKISVAKAKSKSVNIALKVGGSITGKVSGSAGTKNGAVVQTFLRAGDGEWEYGGWAYTRADGTYTVTGLAPGKHAVQFARTHGVGGASLPNASGGEPRLTPGEITAPTNATAQVLWKFWKDKPDLESATLVTVAAKKTVKAISTNLDKKAPIQTLKTATPKISGTAKVGSKLTAKPGAWTKYTTFTYTWYASGKAISGAKKPTFTLTKAQKGKTITVKVTGKKEGWKTASRTSKATAKVG